MLSLLNLITKDSSIDDKYKIMANFFTRGALLALLGRKNKSSYKALWLLGLLAIISTNYLILYNSHIQNYFCFHKLF